LGEMQSLNSEKFTVVTRDSDWSVYSLRKLNKHYWIHYMVSCMDIKLSG